MAKTKTKSKHPEVEYFGAEPELFGAPAPFRDGKKLLTENKLAASEDAKETISALEKRKDVDWLYHICGTAPVPVAKEAVLALERLNMKKVLDGIARNFMESPVKDAAKEALGRLNARTK